MRHRLEFRTVWLSDVHLGSPQCRATELLEFLCALDVERIYLVGDIVDFERLQRRWYWPVTHTRVLERLEQMARTGTDVVWVPGNHDRVLRSMIGQRIGAIRIQRYANHVTAGGDHLLVTHGDQFDRTLSVSYMRERLGSCAYQVLMRLDVSVNQLRNRVGLHTIGLASRVKLRIGGVLRHIDHYERTAVRAARARGYDGIVCGHIHRPNVRTIGGIRYLNDGDWVEHATALVEHRDGTVGLYQPVTAAARVRRAAVPAAA